MRKLNSQNKLLSWNSSSRIDSSSWVIQIRSFFEEEELIDDGNTETSTVCVFVVPNSLRSLKPEAYTPQLIALGPYHYWRQDLYGMERFKLICAKKLQKAFNTLDFEHLVKKLLKKEFEIRGCYQKYLDVHGEALAWMMAIDGLFLLEFLHLYGDKSQDDLLASAPRVSYLVNSMGKKMAYDLILKDILMLENQIPTFVLKKILRIQCTSANLPDNLLPPMLTSVCKEVSPLRLKENYPISKVIQHAHLLDILYHLIIPKIELSKEEIQKEYYYSNDEKYKERSTLGENNEVFTDTWKMASTLKVLSKLKKVFDLKPIKLLTQLRVKVVSKLPILSTVAPILETVFPGNDKGHTKRENENLGKLVQFPLVEEIMLPSVSELSNVGVRFFPTEGDVSTIQFDGKARKFHLPVIQMVENTEVILRNLVAYEASAISGPLVLARYTELMNGLIDTPEDVKILRERKIIISRLKSDEEVAELWNGMTKATRLTKVPFIDKAIEEANGYYNNTSKVKLQKLLKSYVYGSWRILVIFATLLMLGLLGLQSFCSVYSCPNLFHTDDPTTTTK